MSISQRTTYDEEGGYIRILEFEGEQFEFDSTVVRVPPDEDDVFTCHCYIDDELRYENIFKMRELAFDPISPLGRGESDRLGGISSTDTDDSNDDIPRDVSIAMNSIGFAIVPEERWWLDGD